jgi:hypothetical protein
LTAFLVVVDGRGSVVVVGRLTVIGPVVGGVVTGAVVIVVAPVAGVAVVAVPVVAVPVVEVVVLTPPFGPATTTLAARPRLGRLRPRWLEAGRSDRVVVVSLFGTGVFGTGVVPAGEAMADVAGRTRTVVLLGPTAATATLRWVAAGETGGLAACTARAPPAVNAAAPTATCVVVIKAWPVTLSRARKGTSANHETGPTTHRSRPIEMFNSALTISGSNCWPAQRVSSFRAATGLRAFLYERTAVMTSNASATATMRAPSEISSPDRPNG